MLGIHWKKAIPTPGSKAFVSVTDDPDAAFVAGAFRESHGSPGERRLLLGNDGFIPGVYDPRTRSCVIKDDGVQEEEFYILAKTSSVQYDWVSERDGCIPTGAVQCGFTEKGEPLYVGRFKCDGRFLCGKVSQEMGRCDISILGKQYNSNAYEVLCLRTVPIGFTYNSTYNLRSKLSLPSIGSSLLQINGTTPSPTPTPTKTPTVTRTVTSKQSSSITVKKFSDLPTSSLDTSSDLSIIIPEKSIDLSAISPVKLTETRSASSVKTTAIVSESSVKITDASPESANSSSTEVTDASSSVRPRPASPASPILGITTLRPKSLDFTSPCPQQETNGKVKSSPKKMRYSPTTSWQRFGSGSRLVRSPANAMTSRLR